MFNIDGYHLKRHSGESRNPCFQCRFSTWIPDFPVSPAFTGVTAGMTDKTNLF